MLACLSGGDKKDCRAAAPPTRSSRPWGQTHAAPTMSGQFSKLEYVKRKEPAAVACSAGASSSTAPAPAASAAVFSPQPFISPKQPASRGGARAGGSAGADAKNPLRKPCNCRNSRCLKLYCECFASGQYCSSCNCQNCANNPDNDEARKKAIAQTLERCVPTRQRTHRRAHQPPPVPTLTHRRALAAATRRHSGPRSTTRRPTRPRRWASTTRAATARSRAASRSTASASRRVPLLVASHGAPRLPRRSTACGAGGHPVHRVLQVLKLQEL